MKLKNICGHIKILKKTKKLLTKLLKCDKIYRRSRKADVYGGIAQLARAFGSYPTGRWFKSDFRYHKYHKYYY